ncbi:transporter [Brevundimonas sp. AAP58]|uniref:efflux RND transporter permease subunit n=1 Tax=Brevundimonas sp. AAP58 TaxID=1523422 RepID=UPI0006B99FC0|nr:multidrug efflux RND transporter permease subunit [Brevundimonas sp. AAP58]KPF79949.1 transporter [Brevundimonas sp. AAP58]
MIARYFIDRPVLANVIAILMMVIGGIAIFALPVAQYPPLAPPTISVTASAPGANAQTILETVARPIERQVNGVEGMLYMQSTSSNDGRYSLLVTFEPGTDLDAAQVLVQNRVAIALPQLPQSAQQQGVVTRQRSTAILQMVTLVSKNGDYNGLELANFAGARIRDELVRLPGVGDVTVFGVGAYSMRVWLDPELMSARGLQPNDVLSAIARQSQRVSAGSIGSTPARPGELLQLSVDVDSSFETPEDFASIIVKSGNEPSAPLTRLGDVARVELGSNNYGQNFRYDGQPAAGLAIYQLPDANALETAERVEETLERLSAQFPPGLEYTVPLDTTEFVEKSIHEVYKTLIEAGILVLLVILLFLQDWRATLIPATTVPVTIIGAFAAMAALGFSINLLTLFAIVLSIGIVVDDAIIVVEGVTQRLEQGMAPREAAAAAMGQLLGPILGITLVLMAVFLPAAFMPGVTGEMYRQFALVIAATAFLSAVNAITLKPTQSAQWLRAKKQDAEGAAPSKHPLARFRRGFERGYGWLERRYLALVERIVRRSVIALIIGLALCGLAVIGLVRTPTGFIPTEDQGYMLAIARLPSGATLERTERATAEMTSIVQAHPAVEHVIAIDGVSALDNNASLASAGLLYIVLKPWDERDKIDGGDLPAVFAALNENFRSVQDASILLTVPPSIPGLGLSGGFQMQAQLVDGSVDYGRLSEATNAIASRAADDPAIQQAFSPFRADAPQLSVRIDRERAQALGVAPDVAFDALTTYLGSSFANQFTRFGQTYTVFVQADAEHRMDVEDITRLSVRSRSGAMVPLSAFANVERTTGPALISLYNLYPTAAINGSAAPGYSSGQALTVLERLAEETLPSGMSYAWTGLSYQEKLAGSAAVVIFALSILLVYLVLAGQYESWLLPLSVIGAVPLALLGTVAVLLALGLPNTIYTQIGLVLLIALSAKNGILIVEVARERRIEGETIEAAVVHACRERFRPILMTSLSFILGVVPLILSDGAGAAARKSIGVAVFSGMIASTVLALVFVPAFFVVLSRLSETMERRARRQPKLEPHV